MNNNKQFGVWMDTHHATVDGIENPDGGEMTVLAHIKGEETSRHSNETHAQNHDKYMQLKFFKDIASHLVNATHVHVTGTGQAQEQFIHYLSDTAQFKNSITNESTSIEMSDEKPIEYITENL